MLIYFSSFFLEFNKALSPALVSTALLWVLALYKLKFEKKGFYTFLIYFTITFSILIYQYFNIELKYGFINELLRHLLPFMTLAGVTSYLSNKNSYTIVRLSKGFINFNLILLSIETIYRLASGLGSSSFYGFKHNSILYTDSNFTALHALSILFLMILLQNYIFINRFKFKVSLLCLIVLLCFSRTAWFAVFLVIIIYYFILSTLQIKILVTTIFSIGLFTFLNSSFFLKIYNDASFETKLYIYDNFIHFLSMDLKTVLLGYGSGNLVDVIGRQSHNFWGLTMEMGMIWLILIFIVYFYIFKVFGKNSIILLSPALISGLFSLYPLAYLGVYFTSITLLYNIEKKL